MLKISTRKFWSVLLTSDCVTTFPPSIKQCVLLYARACARLWVYLWEYIHECVDLRVYVCVGVFPRRALQGPNSKTNTAGGHGERRANRDTSERERESKWVRQREMSNKLSASNILFISQGLLVTHSEYIFFVTCMCVCMHLNVFVHVCVCLWIYLCLCMSAHLHCVTCVYLHLHVGVFVIFMPLVYIYSTTVPYMDVDVWRVCG